MTITPMPGSWAATRLAQITKYGSIVKTFDPSELLGHTVHVIQADGVFCWACEGCEGEGFRYTDAVEAIRAGHDQHKDYYDFSPWEFDDWEGEDND